MKYYHADNGQFADNAFINHVATSQHSISYYGVNAHWQNGIAVKWIYHRIERQVFIILCTCNSSVRTKGVLGYFPNGHVLSQLERHFRM